MPLALLLSIVSIYAFMLQSLSLNSKNCWVAVYVVFGLFSLGLFVMSVWHFIQTYYGSEYELLPSAQETENYRQTLLTQYAPYDGSDGYETCEELTSKHFDEYLLKRYIRASSTNGNMNDLRSYNIHKCNSYIIFNIIPILLMFLVFNYSGINKNDQEKMFNVRIVNPVMLEQPTVIIKDNSPLLPKEEPQMSTTPKPPPPPPAQAPEPRYIKEGVKPPPPRK